MDTVTGDIDVARIGTLERDGERITGSFRTLKLSMEIHLRPLAMKRSKEAPDFAVLTRDDKGAVFEVGSAWWKTPADGAKAKFLSLTLDDPSWDAALNLTAFPADADEASFDIVWTRPRQQREAA